MRVPGILLNDRAVAGARIAKTMTRTIAMLPMLIWLVPAAAAAAGDHPMLTAEQRQFFESKIRPLLFEHCHQCHGDVKKPKGGLRVNSRAALLEGGDSGPALVPGHPESSRMIDAVNYRKGLEMPPKKKLSARQVAVLEDWVKMGAPWPGEATTEPPKNVARGMTITAEDRRYWAFQPVRSPAVPPVGGARHPIDGFIAQKLAEKGLSPAPPASRRELIRRVTFDLIGLPPSPEEVDAFVADTGPDAYEKLVDRLLASLQYGERWGRHWLDVVRFAQTNGYERDHEKPNGWRYRDYVIRALNQDKPYDQFVLEQLAGDELDAVTDDSLTATAFFRLGVWDDEPDDKRQAEFDELDDMLATTSNAFLGLTLGCARCHDHKFDPIGHDDYYSMLAFLRNIQPYADYVKRDPSKSAMAKLKSGGQTLCVREFGAEPMATQVLIRGSAATPGKAVQPQFIRVLCPSDAAARPAPPVRSPNRPSTGLRRELAEWITSPRNPMTARVIVNRLWHYHFGRGIVATPNDFGKTGMAPSHPELLDWLASNLVEGGWRLKRLHRLILTSDTYKQSSRIDNARAVRIDPDNALLWRQNLRRLEAEAVRDTILAVSGQLNLKMGGRGIFPTLPKEVLATQSRPGYGWENNTPKEEQARRSVYIFVKRTLGVPLLDVLDFASPDSSQAKRSVTTIAPQALILLNGEFVQEQATAFADRLIREGGRDPEANIRRMFRLAVARLPTAEEAKISREYLQRMQERVRAQSPQVAADESYRQGMALLCKVALNLSEVIYVD
jgi:cytochrome c553